MADVIFNSFELPPARNFKNIEIYHPGYNDDKEAPLITLVGLDTLDGGLVRDVAVTACGIISNDFGGWLEDADGIVNSPILPAGRYWWHLSDKRYPVLKDYRDWQFPDNPLSCWVSKTQTAEGPTSCHLTLQRFGIEQAHLVPRGESEWFEVNQIGTRWLLDSDSDVDCSKNKICLRSDLHKGLDDKLFAFAPKQDQMVIHSFHEKVYQYHNLPLRFEPSRELLLARFAYTILPKCLLPWLKMKKQRRLWIMEDDGLVAKEVSGAECQDIAHGPRPRSTSPKKRRVEDIPIIPNPHALKRKAIDSFDPGVDIGDDSQDEDEDEQKYHDWVERGRGRTRQRV